MLCLVNIDIFFSTVASSLKKKVTNHTRLPRQERISKDGTDCSATPDSSTNTKRKAEATSQKRIRPKGGTLLSGSLDAVVEELKEGCLQHAEELREEKRQRKIDLE